jgi:twin arginine-targeting protein translocase TatB
MFDIGWQELLVVGVIALVVIGPKDMPVAMRTAARMFSKLRALTREFQSTVSEVVREAELDELRRKVQQAGRINVKDELTNLVDPDGRLRSDLHGDEFELEDDLHHEPSRPRPAAAPSAGAGRATGGTTAAGDPPAGPANPPSPVESQPLDPPPPETPAAVPPVPSPASASRRE